MIAIIVAFLNILLWYFLDNRASKQRFKSSSNQYVTDVVQHHMDAVKTSQKHANEGVQQKPLGRLYYSTPGRTYTGLIRDGRVLITGKTWPYPPNKP